MPSLKWVVVVAALVGAVFAWLIRGGLLAPTGQESAIRPGQEARGYHEQVTSAYLRAKQQVRDLQKRRQQQAPW
jgi:hypothetical protein